VTLDDIFWKLLGAIGVVLLTMMVTRVATVAAARRVAYASVGAKLVELLRSDSVRKGELFVELTRLVMDSNRDLDAHIERLVHALNAADTGAEALFLKLLDRMRATAFLANVRESFVGSGSPRVNLLAKLLQK